MHISLNTLLAYQNEAVLTRFAKDYPDAEMTPVIAWRELMKYIWLSVKLHDDKLRTSDAPTLQFMCDMHPEMKSIDQMWHTFLLFTEDYQRFCRDYLSGIFFHHVPQSKPTKKMPRKQYALALSRYLSYIYDHLGEETLMRWFNP